MAYTADEITGFRLSIRYNDEHVSYLYEEDGGVVWLFLRCLEASILFYRP